QELRRQILGRGGRFDDVQPGRVRGGAGGGGARAVRRAGGWRSRGSHNARSVVSPCSSTGSSRPAEAAVGGFVTDAPRPLSTAQRLEDLREREAAAVSAADSLAVQKQHARGKKTARERITDLLD